MRKGIKLVSILLLIALLSGCGVTSSVEELLVAPSLDESQTAVLSALEQSHPNRITFVYPFTGLNRSAIQKYDLDSDGADEILVFFRDTSEGLNASMSVLEQRDDLSYYVSSTEEGFGDSVNSVFYLSSAASENVILVEWSSPNKSSNTISVYTYADNKLGIGFEENSLDLLILDLDENDYSEFCYLVPASNETGFALKYVRSAEGTIFSRSQFNLSSSTIEVESLRQGLIRSGDRAIFVDELSDTSLQTEIFLLSEDKSRLIRAEDLVNSLDLIKLSQRPTEPGLKCLDIDGVTCFPSSTSPSQNVFAPDSWVYWYTLDESEIVYARTTYYSEGFSTLFSIPNEWAEFCNVRVMSDNHFEIIDGNTDERLASVVMLSVDDDVFNYVVDGYSLIGTNGTTRYYMSINASQEDENFIRESFIVLG